MSDTLGQLMQALGNMQSASQQPVTQAPGSSSIGALMGAQAPADPLDYTNKYNTPIPPEKQAAFNKWVTDTRAKTGRDPLADRYDYDVNGLFLSGQGTDARGHSTDEFKKPNHITFSDQSKYHGVGGNYGGTWINQNGGQFFQPGAATVKMHGIPAMKQYFNQEEPNIQLLTPPAAPQGVMQ